MLCTALQVLYPDSNTSIDFCSDLTKEISVQIQYDKINEITANWIQSFRLRIIEAYRGLWAESFLNSGENNN